MTPTNIRPTLPCVSDPSLQPTLAREQVDADAPVDAPEPVEPPAHVDPHGRRAASQRDAAAFTARTGRPTIVNADGSWAPLGRGNRRSPAARRSA